MRCLNSPIASGQAPLYPANVDKRNAKRPDPNGRQDVPEEQMAHSPGSDCVDSTSVRPETAAVPNRPVVTTCCPKPFPEEEVHLPGLLPKGSPAVSQISTSSFLSNIGDQRPDFSKHNFGAALQAYVHKTGVR